MALPIEIKNGEESAQELGEGVMKVVVVGPPSCGKTRFIRAFYDTHERDKIYSRHGVRIYPCEYEINNRHGRVAFFEMTDNGGFLEDLISQNYNDADVIVYMYPIDVPTSIEKLTETWLPKINAQLDPDVKPIVVVGSKKDLRDNPEVIERLALENKTPITYEQGEDLLVYEEIRAHVECSYYNMQEINTAFNAIFNIGQYNEL